MCRKCIYLYTVWYRADWAGYSLLISWPDPEAGPLCIANAFILSSFWIYCRLTFSVPGVRVCVRVCVRVGDDIGERG